MRVMRRKAPKSRVPAAVSGEAGPAGEGNLPAVSWEELLARAEAALDEKGLEAQERRRVAGEKKLRRLKERGLDPKWDVPGIKRALAAYYADSVLGDCRLGFRKIFAAAGVVSADFFDARDAYPELRLVFEYIVAKRKEISQTEADELSRQAQASQKRLVTEDGCDLNQRAVELSLKATMPGVYGDSGGEKGGEKGKQIVYKFENLTANFIMSPSELAAKKLDAATPVSDIIYG